MEELEQNLRQLALEAQKHPPKSRKRQLALQKLWIIISRSGRLYRPPRERIPSNLNYEDVYNEALSNLMLHICDKIDEYDPERGGTGSVMAWVIFLFNTRYLGDAIRHEMRDINRQITRRKLSELSEFNHLDKSDPENIQRPEDESPFLSDKLRQCIREDPENLFKNTHIKGNPNANFQAISLRYLDGVSWQDISEELGVNSIQTLSSFYQRCKTKFQPKLKEYIQD